MTLDAIITAIGVEPYYRDEYGVLYCADCLDILPKIPDKSIDLVLEKVLTNSTNTDILRHEKQKRSLEETDSREVVGEPQGRNSLALQSTELVNGPNSEALRHLADRDGQGNPANGHCITRQGEKRRTKRSIQGWEREHALPPDDRQGQMRELREHDKPSRTSQKRKSSRQSPQEPSGALLSVSQYISQEAVVEDSEILCITDPPYGVAKASWDASFPTDWIPHAKRIAHRILCMPGNTSLIIAGSAFGDLYRDIIVMNATNGMTRSAIAFGNWFPVIAAGDWKFEGRPNLIKFTVDGVRAVKHPSPKPLNSMLPLLKWYSKPTDLILDPFCGSGTTLVAAKQLGRKYIGIEISPAYAAICVERLKQRELFS